MSVSITHRDVFGLVKPAVDAHTLGLSVVEHLLQDCGLAVVVGDDQVSRQLETPNDPASVKSLEGWIRENRISRLGFSYRLSAEDGATLFDHWMHIWTARRLFLEQGGPIASVSFAGLPEACRLVSERYGNRITVFQGDESLPETLERLGVPSHLHPASLSAAIVYDEARLRFGRDLVRRGDHLAVKPVDRSGYSAFGTDKDTLVARIRHSRDNRLPPLLRAHMGPYLPDRSEAVRLFYKWVRDLAATGFLDVLSIGTSQLSQSAFGEDWAGQSNGGGVPINSPEEFRRVWQEARPMLVRTYAGTKNIPQLARLYEDTIYAAWHTLSFWWFSQLDGRGPLPLRDNLCEHLDTVKVVAGMGKPFEPNVPHHFAFRGADDVTYVVSGVLAARTAKRLGIRHLVLQIMLNTPKMTWGVQDLAKARALLGLVRELEDPSFQVFLQPRAGLDYFSPDLEKAKAQLAAVTAMVDDIEPGNPRSPDIIHVVSYSEADHLADPRVVAESAQITHAALSAYRRMRDRGEVEDMSRNPDAMRRTDDLLRESREVLASIESAIPDPYSVDGLYQAFADGFLPVPWLWSCREQFPAAVTSQTRLIDGSVRLVDESGIPISAGERARNIAQTLRVRLDAPKED